MRQIWGWALGKGFGVKLSCEWAPAFAGVGMGERGWSGELERGKRAGLKPAPTGESVA